MSDPTTPSHEKPGREGASNGLRARLGRYRRRSLVAGALALLALAAMLALAAGSLFGDGPAEEEEEAVRVVGQGEASYYGSALAGRPTASGEPFDPGALTAAHRTLPLGSRVRVTNLGNGESVVVRINDRGPYRAGRIIDLSERAAERIDMLERGKANVEIELLEE